MPVRIRLSRFGRLHRPYFRIIACDGRVHREGKANEILGVYDPLLKDKNVEIDLAKVEAWVKRGAQISDSLRSLLKHHGYAVPTTSQTAKPAAKAAGKKAAPKPTKPTAKGTYVAPTRRELRKHQAKLKAARKAEAEKNKPAAPAAEAPAETPKA